MALLSAKNFTAPFANRVHLSTIAFVVVLFAAFRAMGGAFSMETIERGSFSGSPSSRLSGLGLDAEERADFGRRGLDEQSNRLLPRFTEDDSDMVSSAVRAIPAETAQPAETRRTPAAGDLDEIMRRLDGR